jgi:hypothetical protein
LPLWAAPILGAFVWVFDGTRSVPTTLVRLTLRVSRLAASGSLQSGEESGLEPALAGTNLSREGKSYKTKF